MVEPDFDEAVAEEAGFDGGTPGGVALSLSWVRHGGDYFRVFSADQSQILLALAVVEFPMPGMEKVAGSLAF